MGLFDVCRARQGERCRDCIYEDNQCRNFRLRHQNEKPMYWSEFDDEDDEEDDTDD